MADQTLASIPAQQQEWPGRTGDLTPAPDHGETGYQGRERLVGKRALITGGDSGIGRATAIAFAKEGADVAISYLAQEQDDAEETQRQVEAAGRMCVLCPTDQRTEQANIDLAQKAGDALGGIDVLVSNAAYQMTHEKLEDFPGEQVKRTFETNVFATFWLAKALAPKMAEGSSIAITTSTQAFSHPRRTCSTTPPRRLR